MMRRSPTTRWGRSFPNRPGRRAGPSWARLAALAGILGGLVIVAAFIIGWVRGDSCSDLSCPSSVDAQPPAGFTFASKLYELRGDTASLPDGAEFQLSVKLDRQTDDARSLALYEYDPASRSWTPLGAAVLSDDGRSAHATVAKVPAFVAVLRRLLPAGHVIGYLPAEQTLHPSAVGALTVLHTVDFRPGADGGVEGQPTQVPDRGGALWLPTVYASSTATGSLANVDAILSSAGSRTTHVQSILRLVRDTGADGVDLAYLDLRPDLRQSFSLLVLELSQALHKEGKLLSLTLPPPQRLADRVDEGAYDWKALGQAADIVQIAPMRDQRTYRMHMPDILEYLKLLVPANKLVLTVTPYATESSAEGFRTLKLAKAMRIAAAITQPGTSAEPIRTNANVEISAPNIDRNLGVSGIVWDPNTATVTFTYKQNGNRTVWIENAFSIGFKPELATKHQLGGIAIEDVSADPLVGDIWPALKPFIESGQPVLVQPNPADLEPRWSASGGTLQGGARGSVTWTAPPQPGTYRITLQVGDGVFRFENTIDVAVQPASAAGTASTTASGG
ncbi:MAG: glycosyl hydrolase family 18 protein [Chloroflexota bacterium]|nr:glycosyl hydrolase family 18 protein [Dehalococcoidia bacterium]MDW8046768.1 glycosyl hydrolase family 18 protein [Chloroflexota bacterium]